ncbi:fatty acid desaturase [Sphingomonas swuensis]|uniref:Fatty acid desaturase n=1 Tax=Sphingomonas swuensis TaxID=977800 RepID=A0ABP7T8N7_9SPHN
MHEPTSTPADIDPKAVLRQVAAFREPRTGRSLFELAVTVLPFALLWAAMWASLSEGYWIGLLLTIPAGGFLLRMFLIQHDCGHGAFFSRQWGNDWLGRFLGVFTLTPYDYWRRSHATHHATTGNLELRGVGDIDTLTVSEYRALSPAGRLRYRIYRNPIVLFGIGPAYLFMLRHRLPVGMMRGGWRPWASALGTNAGIAVFAGLLIWAMGWKLFLMIFLPTTLVAASLGVWFFYVQHQFEQTHWSPRDEWSFHEAALHGSSYYVLPTVIHWFSANIGMHHVHHLASRIPFYRLPEAMREVPVLTRISRLTVRESFRTVRLALWDDRARRLISFREARATA